MKLTVFIPGDPVAQPRPRFSTRGGTPRAYTPKGHPVVKWRKLLAEALALAAPDKPAKNQVVLYLEFNITRPKKHFGTGRNSDALKMSAPDAHIQKPDIENLVKPVMDEMVNAGWMRDDCIVDELRAIKYWCMPSFEGHPTNEPGVEIEMRYDE